jgi:hypothetical protein
MKRIALTAYVCFRCLPGEKTAPVSCRPWICPVRNPARDVYQLARRP